MLFSHISNVVACQMTHSPVVGGGLGEDVTAGWPMSRTGQAEPPPCTSPSLEWVFLLPFSEPETFQGCSLERAICRWDHLDGILDCMQLRLLYKLLRFWRTGADIYWSLSHPRRASYVSSLAYYTCLFRLPLLALMYWGPFHISYRKSWVCKPTPDFLSGLAFSIALVI